MKELQKKSVLSLEGRRGLSDTMLRASSGRTLEEEGESLGGSDVSEETRNTAKMGSMERLGIHKL